MSADSYGVFEGTGCVTPDRARDGWVLHSDLTYTRPDHVAVTAPAGMLTDGASIPRLLWRVAGHPYQPRVIRAAIIHDYLYRTHDSHGRAWADQTFLLAMLADGVRRPAALAYYRAVRTFGWAAWRL